MKTITLKNKLQKYSKQLLQMGFAALLFTSCEVSDDMDPIIIDDNQGEVTLLGGQELEDGIQQARQDRMQTFTIDASTGGTIIGEDYTSIYFFPNSFLDQNGDTVTGSVDIELIEIYTRADMVLTKLPTNGRRDNGDVEALQSAGEFFINARQNGSDLQTTGYTIFAPNDTFDPEMALFVAENCDAVECDVVWDERPGADGNGVGQGEGQGPDGNYVTGYQTFRDEFGWTNLDRWYNFEGPKTIVFADVPEGYDDSNSNVYIAYEGEPGSLALLDIYDTNQELFTEHYGQIPVGQNVHFIFVSIQNGDYVYAVQSTTIVDNHIEVFTNPQTTTEAGLIAIINALP